MAAGLEKFVERYRRPVEASIEGDPSPQDRIWSGRDEVTLANPLGPTARGRVELVSYLQLLKGCKRVEFRADGLSNTGAA
jgi:hypothetical protein